MFAYFKERVKKIFLEFNDLLKNDFIYLYTLLC